MDPSELECLPIAAFYNDLRWTPKTSTECVIVSQQTEVAGFLNDHRRRITESWTEWVEVLNLGYNPGYLPPQAQGNEKANMKAKSLFPEGVKDGADRKINGEKPGSTGLKRRRNSRSRSKASNDYHSLKGRDENKNRANMQKASSWINVMTFPGCLLLSNYRPYSSLCNEQRSLFSIWLPLLGMLNFTVFLSSLFLMVICGARSTRLHVILLISAMLIMNAYITGSIVELYVAVLGILLAGSFARA